MLIQKEPIWIMEAMNICYLKVNQERMLGKLDKSNQSHCYKMVEDLIKKVMKQIKVTDDMVYYFCSFEKDKCLANILLYTYFDFYELSVDDISDEWIKRLDIAFDMKYGQDKMNFFGLELAKQGYDLWTWFEKSEFDQLERYKLIKALHQSKSTVKDIMNILNEVVKILKNEYMNYHDILEKFYIEFDNSRILYENFLHNHIIKWSNEYYFVPTLSFYFTVKYVGRNYFEKYLNILYGIGVDLEYSMNYTGINLSKKNEFLKIISDQSKYSILQFLQAKRMYGQEIANKMNLKTSTISYHMDSLINLNLIFVEKENNRVYYKLNHKQLLAYFDEIKGDFI